MTTTTSRNATIGAALLFPFIAVVLVLRWSLLPVYDFDTVVIALLPAEHHAQPVILLHAPLLPALLYYGQHLLDPRLHLIVLGIGSISAALAGFIMLLSRFAPNLRFLAAAVLLLVASRGFMHNAVLLDDNFFSTSFMLLSVALILQRRTTPVMVVLSAVSAAVGTLFHLTMTLQCAVILGALLLKPQAGNRFSTALMWVASFAIPTGAFFWLEYQQDLLLGPSNVAPGKLFLSFFSVQQYFLFAGMFTPGRIAAWCLSAIASSTLGLLPLPAGALYFTTSDAFGFIAKACIRGLVVLAGLVLFAAPLAALLRCRKHPSISDAGFTLKVMLISVCLNGLFALIYEPASPERWSMCTTLALCTFFVTLGCMFEDLQRLLPAGVSSRAGRWTVPFAAVVLIALASLSGYSRSALQTLKALEEDVPAGMTAIINSQEAVMASYYRPQLLGFAALDDLNEIVDYVALARGRASVYSPVPGAFGVKELLRDACSISDSGKTIAVANAILRNKTVRQWVEGKIVHPLGTCFSTVENPSEKQRD